MIAAMSKPAATRSCAIPTRHECPDTCSGTTNWCKGKLVKAERFNYPVIGSTTFTAVVTIKGSHPNMLPDLTASVELLPVSGGSR